MTLASARRASVMRRNRVETESVQKSLFIWCGAEGSGTRAVPSYLNRTGALTDAYFAVVLNESWKLHLV